MPDRSLRAGSTRTETVCAMSCYSGSIERKYSCLALVDVDAREADREFDSLCPVLRQIAVPAAPFWFTELGRCAGIVRKPLNSARNVRALTAPWNFAGAAARPRTKVRTRALCFLGPPARLNRARKFVRCPRARIRSGIGWRRSTSTQCANGRFE